MKILMERGAYPYYSTRKGATCLDYCNSPEIMKLLLSVRDNCYIDKLPGTYLPYYSINTNSISTLTNSGTDEILLVIYYHLDSQSLGRIARVNRRFQRVAEDEQLWEQLCKKKGISQRQSIHTYLSIPPSVYLSIDLYLPPSILSIYVYLFIQIQIGNKR